MKKLLSLFLALTALLAMLTVSAAAEDEIGQDGFAHETYKFRVHSNSEDLYLAFTNAGDTGSQRFSDQTLETVYHFTVMNIYTIEKITWHALDGSQLLLQVSQSWDLETDADTEWLTVYAFEWTEDMGEQKWLSAAERDYDLTDFFDPALGKDLYIRIADSSPEDGFGGSIFTGADNYLDIAYTPLTAAELDAFETASDSESVSIHGMNGDFSGFEFESADHRAGSACAVKEVGTGFVNQQTFAPVNAAGFDTFEFDWYISDIALLDKFKGEGMNTGIELSSSGKCDDCEISWNFSQIELKNAGGYLVNGWNHVILYLSGAEKAGEIDLSAVNFCRIFMVGETEDTGITVKYDNLRFTKKYASALADAAKEAQAYIDKIESLIETAKDGINDENLKAVRNAYHSASKAVESVIDPLISAQIPASLIEEMNQIGRAIEAFESGETLPPETAGEPDDTEGTETDGEPSKTLLIAAIAAAVVVIAAVLFVLIRKKKK